MAPDFLVNTLGTFGIKTMSIWKPLSVTDEPRTIMSSWQLFKTPEGNIHIVGWCGEGRVSSKIVKMKEDIATTRSGRKYQLNKHNEGCTNIDALYVLDNWLRLNNLENKDIQFIDKKDVVI